MNTEFANTQENIDYNLLEDFNSKLNIRELGRTPRYTQVDASGYTQDNKEVAIELKKREANINTYNELYIEQHKFLEMLEAYVYNKKIPLYINFMKDGVIVFNLAKLGNKPKEEKQRAYSVLYEGFEISTRHLLPTKDAWIYKKDNNGNYVLQSKPS